MLLRATGEGVEEGEKELAPFFSEGKLLDSVVGFGSEALDLYLGIEACARLVVECAYLIDVGSALLGSVGQDLLQTLEFFAL